MEIEQKIDEFVRQKHYRQLNSIIIWQENGMFVKRYYNHFQETSKNVIKSVAKSIMSIAVGIALDRNLIESLDEPIYQYIPQLAEGREPFHKAIRLRHLLTMTSGIYWNGGIHYHCPMMTQLRRCDDWLSHIADCAMTEVPGTKWVYKEWDIILLAKVLDAVCGDMYDFLNENLYQPLEIISDRWYRTPCGVYYSVGDGREDDKNSVGSKTENCSNLSALDMLKIGQLFLNNGLYKDQRIISEDYVKQAVSPVIQNAEYGLDYGYLWWLGENWYGCRGFGGQSITVVPEKRRIIVTQATPTARGMGYHDLIGWCIEQL